MQNRGAFLATSSTGGGLRRSLQSGWQALRKVVLASTPAILVLFTVGLCGYTTNFIVNGDDSNRPFSLDVIQDYYYPVRPLFSFQSRPTYVTLNSIKDDPAWTPGYGSNGVNTNHYENEFFLGSLAGQKNYRHALMVTAGNSYDFLLFYHNDALPGSRNATAHNTRVKVYLPGNFAGYYLADATISADNAIPQTVGSKLILASREPKIFLATDGDVSITPTRGTTKHVDPQLLWSSGGGMMVDCGGPSGDLPADDDCSGIVSFRIKADSHQINAQVRGTVNGAQSWMDDASAGSVRNGDTLTTQIDVWNSGTQPIDSITFSAHTDSNPRVTLIDARDSVSNLTVPHSSDGLRYLIALNSAAHSGSVTLKWRIDSVRCGETGSLNFQTESPDTPTDYRYLYYQGACS